MRVMSGGFLGFVREPALTDKPVPRLRHARDAWRERRCMKMPKVTCLHDKGETLFIYE